MNGTMKSLLVLGAGVVTGIAAGITLGFLYAPNKGEETRRKLRSQAQSLEDRIINKFESVRHNDCKEKQETRHNVAETVK